MLKRFLNVASPVQKLVALSLLTVTTITALTAVWLCVQMLFDVNEYRSYQQKLEAFDLADRQHEGASVYVHANNLSELTRRLSEKPGATWVSVGYDNGDETFVALAKIPDLRIVSSLSVKVTDDNLKQLANQTEIRRLSFGETDVSDEGLQQLEKLNKLYCLSLDSDRITDAGLAQLKPLVSLRKLSISGGNITGSGLSALADLPITRVGLHGAQVSDQGITALPRLKHLTRVNLWNSGITDKGMKSLGACKGLKDIYLAKTAITDEGLQELASLDQLELLDVSGTAVTSDGVAKLRKALPNVTIINGPGTHDHVAGLIDFGAFLLLLVVFLVAALSLDFYMRRAIGTT